MRIHVPVRGRNVFIINILGFTADFVHKLTNRLHVIFILQIFNYRRRVPLGLSKNFILLGLRVFLLHFYTNLNQRRTCLLEFTKLEALLKNL